MKSANLLKDIENMPVSSYTAAKTVMYDIRSYSSEPLWLSFASLHAGSFGWQGVSTGTAGFILTKATIKTTSWTSGMYQP